MWGWRIGTIWGTLRKQNQSVLSLIPEHLVWYFSYPPPPPHHHMSCLIMTLLSVSPSRAGTAYHPSLWSSLAPNSTWYQLGTQGSTYYAYWVDLIICEARAREDSGMTPRFLASKTGKLRVLFIEIGDLQRKAVISGFRFLTFFGRRGKGEDHELGCGHDDFEMPWGYLGDVG